MATMTRRKILAAAGVTTVAGTTRLFAKDKPTPPYHFRDISPRKLIQQRHLPNVELTTMDGKKVRFYDDLVKDRRVVIQFMFARCEDVCPVITHHLTEVERILKGRVGRDIFFYSITLSPEEDRPKDLKAFAKMHGANWLFLTGKPEDILLLRKSLGFFAKNLLERIWVIYSTSLISLKRKITQITLAMATLLRKCPSIICAMAGIFYLDFRLVFQKRVRLLF